MFKKSLGAIVCLNKCLLFCVAFFLLNACATEEFIIGKLGSALGGDSSAVFTSDDDPELVGEAFAFALKLYEILLSKAPDDPELALSAGSSFVMYANAYVQGPAELLPSVEYEKKQQMMKRAARLYRRGEKYIFKAVNYLYPQFTLDKTANELRPVVESIDIHYIDYLYWGAAALLAQFAIDPVNVVLTEKSRIAHLMILRAYELNPDYGGATLDEFFITFYGSMPSYLGGDLSKARSFFYSAVGKSQNLSVSAYLSMAAGVCVAEGNRQEFKTLLQQALEIDIDKNPENRLSNILAQRKAQYLLDHIDDYFFTE